MSADNYALTTTGTRALEEHLLSVAERRQPVFWIALALATMVHVVALIGIGRSTPHRVGDPGGDAGAIDVEIIDAAALHKKMGLPDPADTVTANPPSAAATPPPQDPAEVEPEPVEPEQPPAQEQETPAAEAQPEQETPEAIPALPAEEAKPEAPTPQEPKPAEKKSEKKAPEPAPEAKEKSQAKPKPKPPAKLKPPTNLDLSVPLDVDGPPSSGGEAKSSGVSRPAGITRSGENDRFGRAVIRALKRTMPQHMGINGRVTIRIILNERGNVASVKLVTSGGNRALDGEVLFAAGQTSFPFPPNGAPQVDRTFLVTYIYR